MISYSTLFSLGLERRKAQSRSSSAFSGTVFIKRRSGSADTRARERRCSLKAELLRERSWTGLEAAEKGGNAADHSDFRSGGSVSSL